MRWRGVVPGDLFRHPRFHHEPAHRWLRDAMSELVTGPMHHQPLLNPKLGVRRRRDSPRGR
ncbi:hypothetical protein DF039_08565 [Burkholderia cenocepacia]|nr:hypothetical protein DF039_08565 [Burkholderia cenocepacia]